jgi:hypothetical protein
MTLLRDTLIVRGLGASAPRPVPAVRLAYIAAGRVGVTGQATTTRSAARSTAGHAATHYAAGHTAAHSAAGHAATHFAAASHATAHAPDKYDGAVGTGNSRRRAPRRGRHRVYLGYNGYRNHDRCSR